MRHAVRRPMGRLFYWALAVVVMAAGFGLPARGGAPQGSPATTTVADSVFLGDGTPAQGSLIISWPAFETAGGMAVAAGTTDVTLGAGGALSVALVPNAGATPAGVYYTVVYQLGPGEVKTETWVVPTTSPANLAAVRMTPGSGLAGQPVSMQYVNSELSTKANDSAVVHLSGTETITGSKVFTASPNVPAPVNAGDIANKSYVDQSLANVGAGSYLPTAGGTMTGPITLPANPVAPLQAAPKQYVDFGMAGKADLISGLVPANELGSGTATAGSCLLGNGTWGECGSGGGTGNVSTTPAASQNVAQPEGTQFSTNNLANVRYLTASWNWVQSPTDSLATAGSNTIHLSPCPMGIDTSNNTNRPYYVYVAGTGTAEAALVTGGTCSGGAATGTIVVTTAGSHPAGYTVSSSTAGIQEALNDAGTPGAAIVIPPTGANANALPIYSTIYVQSNKSSLRGEGKPTLLCKTRSVCVFLGDHVNVNDFASIEVSGIRFAAGNNFDGIPITNTACAANVSTISLNNSGVGAVQTGDYVDINWTFNPHYIGIHLVASASATQFTYADVNCGGFTTIASQTSAGFASLEDAAIEDDATASSLHDLHMADKTSFASWGSWQNHIVVDNDQAFKLDTMNLDEGPNCTTNYCGQSIYFPGPFGTNASVAWLSHLNLSLQCGGNGVTDWAGNTLRIQNSVIQGFRQWGVYDGTLRGGYGGGEFDDVYEEVGGCTNPLYPGGGKQGMAGLINNSGGNSIHGGEFPVGQLPEFAASGNQTTRYNYCFVVHDTSEGVSKCLTAGYALVDSASPSGSIVVSWPRVQGTGTVTYDVVRYSGAGNAAIAPYTGGCAGGSTAACGSVAVAVAQCASAFCSFTDTASLNTSSYAVAATSYQPGMFWLPGGIVTLNNSDTQNFGTSPTFLDDDAVASSLSPITTEAGLMSPQVFSQRCSNVNGNEWLSCLAGNSNGNNTMPSATVLQYGITTGTAGAGLKGRLNFTSSQSGSINSGEILTLVDSNPAKTLATPGNRPTQDAADTYLGTDSGSVNYANVGLAMGAPVSISSYINAIPNGTNYLERLTAAGKIFNIPVTVNGNLAVNGGTVTLPITGTGPQCLHASATGVVSGTGSDCGSGSGGGSGTVNSGNATQVAMYSGSGTAVSGDTALTDSGTTLNYAGSGGITATSGTFSGNLTVNGQLQVAGPWMVSSPIPGTAMGAAGTGTSSLGISNDGNFYVSTNGGTPQKVATAATSSYFSNLFQEDANDLGEYSGTNPQGLHVYGTYPSASNYERTGLGWDATDNYFVVRNENAGTGQQRGMGFWIGSGIRWAIDTASVLKPFNNNSFDIGVLLPSPLVPRTIYAATSFDTLTQGRENFELCNDGTAGTALNLLAVYNGATPACAVKAAASSTDGVIGIVSNGSGTSGNAVITYRGYVPCSFDGATVSGDFVTASVATAGDCHDGGATRPTGVQVLGRVESTNSVAGTYGMRAEMDSPASGGAAITSVFGRTGAVTAQSGDYGVGQVTGAAPLTSPAFTGTPTATTAAAHDNSTKIATTAYVDGTYTSSWTPMGNAFSASSGVGFNTTTSHANLFGVILRTPVYTCNVTVYVVTADNSANTYDVGIYQGTSGGTDNLLVHTGAVAGSAYATANGTNISLPWSGSACVLLAPGRYYLAMYANVASATMTLGGDSGSFDFYHLNGFSITPSSGALPSSITGPADGYSSSAAPYLLLH
jgi:hypothetical protein